MNYQELTIDKNKQNIKTKQKNPGPTRDGSATVARFTHRPVGEGLCPLGANERTRGIVLHARVFQLCVDDVISDPLPRG